MRRLLPAGTVVFSSRLRDTRQLELQIAKHLKASEVAAIGSIKAFPEDWRAFRTRNFCGSTPPQCSGLRTPNDTSQFQRKRHFAIRKPLFYPLNYGDKIRFFLVSKRLEFPLPIPCLNSLCVIFKIRKWQINALSFL